MKGFQFLPDSGHLYEPMSKILILFAHPRYEQSRAQQQLVRAVHNLEGVTFHDLYEHYPDFNIDIPFEKELLLQHEVVVWQHPFYWYSAPPLLKQWIDMVLEFGWAYGPGGTMLKDKWVFNVISSGGAQEAYHAQGRNRFTIREYLRPFEQTGHLCGMYYLPPFVVHGTHRLTEEALAELAARYHLLLKKMSGGELNLDHLRSLHYLNDFSEPLNPTQL